MKNIEYQKRLKEIQDDFLNDILNDDTTSKFEKLKLISDNDLWPIKSYIQHIFTFNVDFSKWPDPDIMYEKLYAITYKLDRPIVIKRVTGVVEEFIGNLTIVLSNDYTIIWDYDLVNVRSKHDIINVFDNDNDVVYSGHTPDFVIGSYPTLIESILHYVESLNLF